MTNIYKNIYIYYNFFNYFYDRFLLLYDKIVKNKVKSQLC